MLKFDELPALPEGDRIMVRPNPPVTKTIVGLEIPEVAQNQAHEGKILAAGLKALDIMFDNGQEVGDMVVYGQFAGAWEEWDHIMKLGKDADCEHAEWSRHHPSTIRDDKSKYRCSGYICDACGALRLQEPILIMNVGDVLANITKAERVREGKMAIVIGETAEGKTQHYVPRMKVNPQTNGATHVA